MLNLQLLNPNRIQIVTFLPYNMQTIEHQLLTKTNIVFTDEEVNSTHKAGFFLEYERGNISDNEFRNEFRLRTHNSLSDTDIDYIWNSMLDGIPQVKLQLLDKLRYKYNLYLLSNTNSIHWETFSEKVFCYNGLNVKDIFKNVYLSYRLHIAKPDSFIFEEAIKDSGIDVNETLFVDDSMINCQTAQRLGMLILNYKLGDDLENCILKVLK